MKKLYLLAFALLVAMGVWAQNQVQRDQVNTKRFYKLRCYGTITGTGTHNGLGSAKGYIGTTVDGFDGCASEADAATFVFESAGEENKYYIKANNGKYLSYSGTTLAIVDENPNPWEIAIVDGSNKGGVLCVSIFFYESSKKYCLNNAATGAFTQLQLKQHQPDHGTVCSDWALMEQGSTHAISDAKWSSIYLDYNAAVPKEVEAVYGVTINAEQDKAMLNEVLDGSLQANTGYLVKGEAGNYFFPKSSDAVTSVSSMLLGSTSTSYVAKETNFTHYVLSNVKGNVGFYAVKYNKASDGTEGTDCFQNNANKAYLKVSGSGARVMTFDFDGNAETGINAVEIEEAAPANAAIYDLSGRRVQSAKSGLYIINGKKVIK